MSRSSVSWQTSSHTLPKMFLADGALVTALLRNDPSYARSAAETLLRASGARFSD